MDAVLECCVGLDVHQETVVACVLFGPAPNLHLVLAHSVKKETEYVGNQTARIDTRSVPIAVVAGKYVAMRRSQRKS